MARAGVIERSKIWADYQAERVRLCATGAGFGVLSEEEAARLLDEVLGSAGDAQEVNVTKQVICDMIACAGVCYFDWSDQEGERAMLNRVRGQVLMVDNWLKQRGHNNYRLERVSGHDGIKHLTPVYQLVTVAK